MVKYTGVIFDLDGTLVDTLADLCDAINYGLVELGFESRGVDECRMMIGSGTRKFAERALGSGNERLAGELIGLMKGHYRGHCLDKSRVYDGMGEVIKELSERRVRLGVFTNKDALYAEIIVRHFFGDEAFECILGADGERAIKPDPAGALEILEQFGVAAEENLFVGDSDVDIYTAQNAGMQSVGVTWGFRDRGVLEEAGADIIIDKPCELLDLTA